MKELKDYTNEQLCDRYVQVEKDSEEGKAIQNEMQVRYWRYAIRGIIPPNQCRPGNSN